MPKFAPALLCAAALVSAPAFAVTNLVQNGGFESGFDHWISSGDPAGQYVGHDYTGDPDLINNVFTETAYADLGFIGQQLDTTAGARYILQFDLQIQGDANLAPDTHSVVTFNGTYYFGQTDLVHGWTHYTLTGLTTNSSSTWLQFGNRNYADYTQLDNVSLVMSSIPEPSSALMLALGLGLLGFVRSKRARPF
ncbi:PEP-CTERM sorting domain-containing protein [Oxalobacteraceae bacterium]|nr:PEP-CTERM sorting domain-containing protein [Oxalobacteraceae bacterium]